VPVPRATPNTWRAEGNVSASVDSSAAQSGEATRKAREWRIFFFLTVVLAPLLAVAVVGAYGFVVWIYQMFAGPPAA